MARGGQRGFTIVEVMITLLLVTASMGVIYSMMLGGMRSSMFTEARNDLTQIGQRVVNAVQTDVLQAKLVLQEDSVGGGYRSLFTEALPAEVSVWPDSRLPIVDLNTTTIGPDPGPNEIPTRTGNSLIVVRQLAPVAVPWDGDADPTTPDINLLLDRYEFQYYFLRSNSARSFARLGYYLEVDLATSQIVADYFQLSGITTNQAQAAAALRASTGITLAWNPGKAVGDPAFYDISVAGALSGNPQPVFNVKVKSMVPEFAGGRIGGRMEYSVGLNSNTQLALADKIPLYAIPSAGFPGGLEFMVVGQSGRRKVMTRLVLASWYDNRFTSKETSVITSASGF